MGKDILRWPGAQQMKMQNTAVKMGTSENTARDQRAELIRVVMGCRVVGMGAGRRPGNRKMGGCLEEC